MTSKFTVACIQTNSAREIAPNIEFVLSQIKAARDAGADFITMPECVGMMEPDNAKMRDKTPTEANHPALAAFQDAAKQTGTWILIGSLGVALDEGRIANRSYLVSDRGEIAATYDKIHMFDVDIGDGDYYRESETYAPGARAVLADTPWGRLGMSICYDIRFPYLYRALAHAGAEFITAPAAFTRVSGEAHWHVLQRARAIEHGCYIISAAQCGTHAEGRQTYGHSLIVDPWGRVLADGGEEVGFVTAEIDLAEVAEARRKIPALTHDRTFEVEISQAEEAAVLHPQFAGRS